MAKRKSLPKAAPNSDNMIADQADLGIGVLLGQDGPFEHIPDIRNRSVRCHAVASISLDQKKENPKTIDSYQ